MAVPERRDLAGTRFDRAVCMAAIVRPCGNIFQAKLFFSVGTDVKIIQPVTSVHDIDRRSIGGAAVLSWRTEPTTSIAITVGGVGGDVPVSVPETELFSGLNVGVAIRNGEDATVAADWLAFHRKHHQMNAALIVDRGGNGEFLQQLTARIADLDMARVVVLVPDFPLGQSDLPAEQHPFCAPDAPGKDRMEIPPPDPWRAPLVEQGIYELLKEMYLGDARAVANVDLSDLVLPSGTGIFDQAVTSTGGVVALRGQNCYPWRVRKGHEARFGDHICVQFDTFSGPRRWCVAPARVGPLATWRFVRIVGAEAAPQDGAELMRCMALRHPNLPVSQIVPKSSLVAHDVLLELAKSEFAHKPVQMPKLKAARVKPGDSRTVIVSTMKNEGPFILEWLAYHRIIGVDDFLIYTNDCNDGTDTLLKLLHTRGIVQHRENPYRSTKTMPQHAALKAAGEDTVVRNADWVMCMDVDEFINIKIGKGSLGELYAHMGDANMISCTWRLFGNADVHEFTDEPIIATFDQCAPECVRKPHQAWGFKTLFRNTGIFKKLGVHRPKGLNPQLWEQIKWVNGSGKPLPASMYRNAWRSTLSTYGYDVVSLNHYAVRSAESFLVKRDRGRVNHVARDQGLAYWFRMNNNSERETSIQRMLPRLRKEIDRLLSDPEIAAAHSACVDAHREKIAALRARADHAGLYKNLTSDRMQRLSRMHHHFGANVFLAGPAAVPDEVADTEHPPDFFFSVEKTEATHS